MIRKMIGDGSSFSLCRTAGVEDTHPGAFSSPFLPTRIGPHADSAEYAFLQDAWQRQKWGKACERNH